MTMFTTQQSMKRIILFILVSYCQFSCTQDHISKIFPDLNTKEQPLTIQTKIWTAKYPYLAETFKEGTVIGLYIIPENNMNLYHSYPNHKNIRTEASSSDNNLIWNHTPQIYLSKNPVTVYAYYPYQPQINLDPLNIPIYISSDASQTYDYMYGTQARGQRRINQLSPTAWLYMKHTLSLLNIQVSLTPKVQGPYLLKAIQIGNKSGGTALYFRGSMYLKTGNIKKRIGPNTSTRLNLTSPCMLTSHPNEPNQLMVIPNSQTQDEGDIEILFVINEQTFKYKVPAGTKWRKGKKYSYKFLFDGERITLDKIKISEW